MRIYRNFQEAFSEVKRDLVEMGIRVHAKTYQDKYIADNPDFGTRELQNYIYTVTDPNPAYLNPVQPWADLEWQERLAGIEGKPNAKLNPGEAWKAREDVWRQFLQADGKFAYTYGDRFRSHRQVRIMINRIKVDPDSRQLYISIWNPIDVHKLGGVSRVPCSLGYLIQIRKGKLNITYNMRSCDFITHFNNDVYLACKLQAYMADQTGYEVGTFTHWIGSLHIFNKDSKGVF